MRNIDSAWFKARLKEIGKTTEHLAQAINRDRSVITRIISGEIKFKHEHIAPFAAVLEQPAADVAIRAGLELPQRAPGTDGQAEKLNAMANLEPGDPEAQKIFELTAARGLAEDNARFEGPGENSDDLLSALYPGRPQAVWMRCSTDAMTRFGIMPGDFLIVDPGLDPQPGQAVIAQVVDNQLGAAKTLVRAFYAGLLEPHSHNPSHLPQPIIDDASTTVSVVGVVARVYRATL